MRDLKDEEYALVQCMRQILKGSIGEILKEEYAETHRCTFPELDAAVSQKFPDLTTEAVFTVVRDMVIDGELKVGL